jgi:hypothetical protein
VIFLVGVALVLGGYYVLLGLRNFVRVGGLGVIESTQQAVVQNTATAMSIKPTVGIVLPTPTPVRECIPFLVSVESAIVRQSANANSGIIKSYGYGSEICVLGRAANPEWYEIDTNPLTRRVESGFMHETVIEAVHPTPTPTHTPVVTATPLETATPTFLPTLPQPVPNSDTLATVTPAPPTIQPTATLPLQNT